MFSKIFEVFSPPALPDRGILEKKGAGLYQELVVQKGASERDQQLLKFGKSLLKECRGWGAVEWRQFALMHDASIIGDTKYEGGEIGISLEAWRAIFSLWKKGKGHFLAPKITLKQTDLVLETLATTRHFQGLRPWIGPTLMNLPKLPSWFREGEISRGHLEDLSKTFLRTIQKELERKGQVYLPLGYRHGVASDGHVLICKIVQREGFITIHLLNQGDGVSDHPPVSFTTTQERISYSYYPIKIEDKVFFGEMGEVLFCHLLRYVTDAPHPQIRNYHARDLYDLFKVLGEVIPDLGRNPERFAVNPQSTGNCSEKGVKNIVRDLLLDAGLSLEELQVIFCNAHLCSLVMGYHSYLGDSREVTRVLLQNAARESGFLFQKLKGTLSKEEVGVVTAILTVVLDETERVPPPLEVNRSGTLKSETLERIRQELPQPKKIVDKNDLPTKFPLEHDSLIQSVEEWKIEEIKRRQLQQKEMKKQPLVRVYTPPSFSLETFLDTIQKWNQKLLDLPAGMRFAFMYEAIFTLPIPHGKEESVWDALSIEEGRALLPHLQTFLLRGCQSYCLQNNTCIEHFLAHHTIYAIVDQLSRQNPATKLEGFASPFPDLSKKIRVLPDGRENIRYTQIRDYFSSRIKQAGKGVIFPAYSQIEFEKGYDDLKKQGGRSQVTNHIRYLLQFFKGTSQVSLDQLVSLMCDLEGDQLPKEVYYLYYFASFIQEDPSSDHVAKFYLSSIPEFLRFRKELNNQKKVVLTPERFENKEPRLSPQYMKSFDDLADVSHARDFCDFLQSAEIKAYTTNDAVCNRPGYAGRGLPEAIVRDLLRITRKENLMVGQALDWVVNHFFYLFSSEVQETLLYCFLAPGVLSGALEQEPSLIFPLRKMIKNGLIYLGESPDKSQETLFLISLGVSFELIYKQLYPNTLNNKILKEYYTLIPTKNLIFEIKHKRLQYIIQLERTDLEPEAIEHLFYVLHDHYQDNKFFGLWLQKYSEHLSSQEFINKICIHFLPTNNVRLLIEEVHKQGSHWNGIFPEFSCGPYHFNIETREFRHEKKGYIDQKGWREQSWVNICGSYALSYLIREARLKQDIKWEVDTEKVSEDGTLKLQATKYGLKGERKLKIQGEEKWMEIYSSDYQIIRPALSQAFSNERNSLAFYVPLERKAGDPEVWIYDLHRDIPLYRADSQEGSFTLTLVDQEGNATGKQKANMAPLESIMRETIGTILDHPLAKHLQSFVFPDDIDCIIDSKLGQLETLYFFVRDPGNSNEQQVTFRRGKYGFQSVQYPGFYLTDLTTLPELNRLEGGLILENPQGERRLFLWGRPLFVEAHDFSREVKADRADRENKGRLHVYEVDPISHTLLSQDNLANLYLCYIYKMQKEYEQAFFYLKKVASIDSIPAEDLSRFPQIKDSSPSSLAFNMKLIYRGIESYCQLSEKTITNRRDPSQLAKSGRHFSWNWAISVYTDYLRATSREELSAIPKTLRLSKGEEKTILSYMKRRVDNLPQPLVIRYDLLTRMGGKMEISISKKQVQTAPRAYSHLSTTRLRFESSVGPTLLNTRKGQSELNVFAPYPVQVSDFALHLHFPTLYKQAKHAKLGGLDPFDLTLVTILQQNSSLGTVLFCVRHFPEKYTDLTFDNPKDKVPTQNTWEEITDRTLEILSSKEGKEYLEKSKNQEVTFDYERTLYLSLPNPESPPNFQETIRGKKLSLAPLAFCIGRFCSKEERKVSPSQVEIKSPRKASSLERSLYGSFAQGRKEIPLSRTIYHVASQNLDTTKDKLEQKLSTLQIDLQERRKTLLARLNATHLTGKERIDVEGVRRELEYKLGTQTHQTLPLLPETVMKEGILRNDASFIRKHRPLLTQEEEREIYAHVKEYYYDLMVLSMTKEALGLAKKCNMDPNNSTLQRNLATLLHYEFPNDFDPYEYPEIAYFKVTNGKLPRERQLELYLWVCEGIEKGENRLFQMSAGGGKTSFLTPLIMLRAKSKGYLPVFCSTQSIYPIDKANLHTTLKTLEERLALLEVGMHMKLTVSDLQFIFDQLRIYREEGRELIVTPQIIYSLHLLYQYAAYQEKDEEKVKWLSLILAFWKKRVFLLPDESHRNLDALTRAIYGIGSVDFLPKKEFHLFVDMMKPLLGVEEVLCEDNITVAEKGRLQKNTQGIAGPSEIAAVRTALARYMMGSKWLRIPPDAQEAFLSYWTDKKAPKPEILRKWGEGEEKERADAAALVHYFLLSLLPQIMKMRTELDHAPSVYPEEEFDAPCHHKTPSTAQFEDVYRAIVLSIKGTFHRGLTKKQVHSLLNKLLRKDREEQPHTPSTMVTSTMARFRKWMEDQEISIRKISFGDHSKKWEKVYEKLRFHPKAIEAYLLDSILPKIAHPNELLTTTPTHILNSCAQSVSFSATPYFSQCYPQKIDAFSYDRAFEAQVVLEYCKQENQDYLFPQETDPKLFFPWLAEENPDLFKEVEVLIDPGGFFCDHLNEEIARTWLESNRDLDGAIYFQQGNALSVDRDEKICLLLKRNNKIRSILLEGNQLLQVLKEQGCDYASLRIGTFYDAAHTESADIIQKEKTKALVFGGDTLTSSHLIQAIMRLRGFLDPERDQTLTWVFQSDLAAKIRKRKAFCGETIYAWTVKNEVHEMKNRVILAAFQEISYHVERIAWEEIEEALQDPKKQMELFEKYRGGFCQSSPRDPYKRYGEPEALLPTSEVLWSYAKQEYVRFGYTSSLYDLKNGSSDDYSMFTEMDFSFVLTCSKAQKELIPAIEKIVSETEKIIPQIATNIHNKVSQEVEQQTHVQREVEKEQYRPRPRDPRSAAQIYGTLSIKKPEYPDHLLREVPSRKVFDQSRLTERLHYEANQLRTANEGSVSMGTQYLKPIDFFLIIHYKGQVYAEAVCNEIVSAFVGTLGKEIVNREVKHTAFILTAEGHLYRKGKGVLAPSEKIVGEVLESEWLKDLVIDAALLKGEVRHPDRLKERIAKWPDFPKFWRRIVKSLPNPESANEIIIKKILKELKIPMEKEDFGY
ncbi:MAG: hypothetical protein K940chlam9_00156 [Chlamydiae bacterium]|nr:hypothetical protein [Chlamydiota bacterium]